MGAEEGLTEPTPFISPLSFPCQPGNTLECLKRGSSTTPTRSTGLGEGHVPPADAIEDVHRRGVWSPSVGVPHFLATGPRPIPMNHILALPRRISPRDPTLGLVAIEVGVMIPACYQVLMRHVHWTGVARLRSAIVVSVGTALLNRRTARSEPLPVELIASFGLASEFVRALRFRGRVSLETKA